MSILLNTLYILGLLIIAMFITGFVTDDPTLTKAVGMTLLLVIMLVAPYINMITGVVLMAFCENCTSYHYILAGLLISYGMIQLMFIILDDS